MNYVCTSLLCGAVLGLSSAPAEAQDLQTDDRVELNGELAYADELSGAALWKDLLIACPDEGADVYALKRNGSGYELLTKVNLLSGKDEEIDIEGAASDREHLYIVGSHSMRRKKVDDEGTYRKNRKLLSRVTPHDESYAVFRITLDSEGKLEANQRLSLLEILESDDILHPYTWIPGKENGIDIEGIAVKDGTLFVGFRGPVLRGNYVPVIIFKFDQPEEYELKFVQLGGRGIRDIVAVEHGFLILAGPVGDGDITYRLYQWNGKDCVPGEHGQGGEIVQVAEVPTRDGVKPEALALMSESADVWRLLVLSDGDEHAAEWIAAKP